MRAKFGRDPTAVSKKGSLKFISRLNVMLWQKLTDMSAASQGAIFVQDY